MPIFNNEEYLECSIKSVLAQSFENFELILIDDNSSDDSIKVCKQCINSKCRLIQLQINKGPGNARNIGINIARGKYLLFLDGDDWWDKNILNEIYKTIKAESPQVVLFGIQEEYFKSSGRYIRKNVLKPKEKFLNEQESVRSYIIKLQATTLFRYIWNKAYRADLIKMNGICFSDLRLGEDIEFNVDIFEHVNTLKVIALAPYHYRRRATGSAMGKYYIDYWDINFFLIKKRYSQIKRWHLQAIGNTIIYKEYLKFIFLTLQMSFFKECDYKKINRKKFLQERFQDEVLNELSGTCFISEYKYQLFSLLIRKQLVNTSIAIGYIIYLLKNKLYIIWALMNK